MNFKKGIIRYIDGLTTPGSDNPDTALQEYMTKMILVVLTAVTVPCILLSLLGCLFKIVPCDTFLIFLALGLLFLSGTYISHRGNWRLARRVPPFVLFAIAIYGNIIGGIYAPAILIYILVILLVAILMGIMEMFVTLFFAILVYVSIVSAHSLGYLTPLRATEGFLINRVIISVSVILAITFLIRFMLVQYRYALSKARREIAERGAVEEALRKSETEYRELVQNAGSLIMRMNLDGELTFCNYHTERVFGYSKDEVVGLSLIDTIIPGTKGSTEDLKRMIDNMKRSIPAISFNESEHLTRSGKRVWINWANSPVLDDDGNLVEILCIGNDITEQKVALEEKKKIEAQLIQSQKMEAIGTLTSGLAHDFNNMLGGIIGSISILELLLNKENLSQGDKADRYIKLALESSKRASAMIQKLLLLSRKQEVKLVPVNINRSIDHVIEICSNSFPKSISIDVSYGDGPMNIMADPVLIEQMFLNFCVNASHAMTIMRDSGEKDGGVLKIRTMVSVAFRPELLQPDDNARGINYIVTEISDSGVGMDADTRLRIFEPFFTTKKKEAGTGLGLSIAYGLITQLGGFIEIDSEPGKGSTFRIYIPELADINVIGEAKDTSTGIVKGAGTILVIDDELTLLTVAEDILSLCGYTVLKASDGMSGIAVYRDSAAKIDAVLLDISMPYMSGFEVFEKLRVINPGVKALLCSGYPDDERISGAIESGNADFITKPYTAEELSRRISELILNR